MWELIGPVLTLIQAVPTAAPMVAAVGILYGVYLLSKIGTNHLHELPKVAQDIDEMKGSLKDIRDGIVVLVDRSRGN